MLGIAVSMSRTRLPEKAYRVSAISTDCSQDGVAQLRNRDRAVDGFNFELEKRALDPSNEHTTPPR
jgi:hypothetical protein